MNFEGVNFNEVFWKTKTEAEFIAHESHHGLSEKQLKEAFGLMNPKRAKKGINNQPDISTDKKEELE